MVKEKFARHDLMAMEGRSAGGLLMGAVLNLRPDLTHVAIGRFEAFVQKDSAINQEIAASVPFVDVINTSGWR